MEAEVLLIEEPTSELLIEGGAADELLIVDEISEIIEAAVQGVAGATTFDAEGGGAAAIYVAEQFLDGGGSAAANANGTALDGGTA
jgi:hypothetical protein